MDGDAIFRRYRARTLAGFSMNYTLEVSLRTIINYVFVNPQEVVEAWHKELFLPEMRHSFFTLGFSTPRSNASTIYPQVHAWRIVETGGSTAVIRDDGNLLAAAIRERCQKMRWECHGCDVLFHDMKLNVSGDDIEENYKMLTREQVQQAEASEPYSKFQEIAAATAYNVQQELTVKNYILAEDLQAQRREQIVSNSILTVQTYGMGNAQLLKWTITNRLGFAGLEVIGFRRSGSFGGDPLSETGNGERIVHSRQDGSSVDQLEEGKTYYYTFIIRHRSESGTWLRFTVSVPSTAEQAAQLEQTLKLKELEQRLQAVTTPKVTVAPRDKELQELLANMSHGQKRDQMIRDFRANGVKQIENDAALSAKEKRERIRALEELIIRETNSSF